MPRSNMLTSGANLCMQDRHHANVCKRVFPDAGSNPAALRGTCAMEANRRAPGDAQQVHALDCEWPGSCHQLNKRFGRGVPTVCTAHRLSFQLVLGQAPRQSDLPGARVFSRG